MTTASVHMDPAFVVAPVRRRIFGSFVEHMGRCVYTGIYEPGHPSADTDGFRGDVLDLVRELGVSVVRYPGGNFVSGYRWEDGIGPVDDRPVRRDLAWHTLETNAVGIDEFAAWAKRADVEVMYSFNLGTRGVQEALDAHEYINHEKDTALSDLRRKNGAEQPYGVKLFCLGNEMDGPWQTGHKTAHEYGRLAAEVARALRSAEPDLELVACGSSSSAMPTFGAWESEVLELTYDQVDYISAHAYYQQHEDDLGSFLASGVNMDHFIDSVVATADSVGARLKNPKKIEISFDEWNVWYQSRFADEGAGDDWTIAKPLIEDVYNVADAVVVGGLLISLLRHSDRVGVACLAQLVNVIAPVMTEADGPAWRQTIFHPFSLTSRFAQGVVLRVEPQCDTYATERHGEVPLLDATATYDESTGELTVFVLNRSQDASVTLESALTGFGDLELVESWVIGGGDPHVTNDKEHPDRVVPTALESVTVAAGSLRAELPAVSWCAIRLRGVTT